MNTTTSPASQPQALTDERTPQDRAIEHAEYMAGAAERLVSAVQEHAAAHVALVNDGEDPDSDEDISSLNERCDRADELVGDAMRSVQNRVYEFRKRRDRAVLSARPATAAAGVVEVCPDCDIADCMHIRARRASGATAAAGVPETGGVLGMIETHPNYVAGFKAGYASAKDRPALAPQTATQPASEAVPDHDCNEYRPRPWARCEMCKAPPAPEVLENASDAWPKLDKPARVVGTFGVGVSSRLVVEAAQRYFESTAAERARTPQQRREDEIRRRVGWDLLNGYADIEGATPAQPAPAPGAGNRDKPYT